jgi:hypothetical protein
MVDVRVLHHLPLRQRAVEVRYHKMVDVRVLHHLPLRYRGIPYCVQYLDGYIAVDLAN